MEAGFEPIGPRTAFEGAVEQIAQRIRHGDLGEGDHPGVTGDIFVASDYVPIELLRLQSDVRLAEVAGVLEPAASLSRRSRFATCGWRRRPGTRPSSG
jgi:hypothetical protein